MHHNDIDYWRELTSLDKGHPGSADVFIGSSTGWTKMEKQNVDC